MRTKDRHWTLALFCLFIFFGFFPLLYRSDQPAEMSKNEKTSGMSGFWDHIKKHWASYLSAASAGFSLIGFGCFSMYFYKEDHANKPKGPGFGWAVATAVFGSLGFVCYATGVIAYAFGKTNHIGAAGVARAAVGTFGSMNKKNSSSSTVAAGAGEAS